MSGWFAKNADSCNSGLQNSGQVDLAETDENGNENERENENEKGNGRQEGYSIPYSGKFSYGANFRMLHPLYEKKKLRKFERTDFFFLSRVTFDLYAPHAVASWRC